ncbi:DegT/DnrJ/EryC1/StrS family aminotransferase, partial [Rhizobium leguminosarum bv. viciae]
LYERLKENSIHPRRYFYPLISSFSMYRSLPSSQPSNLPVATEAAQQVLCLPIYPDMEMEIVDRVCALIASLSTGAFTASRDI